MGMSTRHATNGARRRLQGHALDLGAWSRCQFFSSRWPCSIHPGCSSCSCVLLQNEFFKKASTSTCAFMLPMDWVGIPMPRCSVNGACNLVRVRAIRFPPLRHWPRCGCSAQALAGFITAGLLPPLQFVVGSKMAMRAVIPLLAVRVCSSSRRPCPWGHRELAHIHNNGGTGGLFSRWFEPLPVQAPPHRRQGAPGPNVPRLAVWLSSSFDLWLRPRPRRLSTSFFPAVGVDASGPPHSCAVD